MKPCRFASAMIWILASSLLAYGQVSSSSSLSGTVADPSGAVVPGASVKVRNVDTGAIYKAESGANGALLIPSLGTGTYSVTVMAAGFRQAQINNVKIDVGVPAQVQVSLEVGSQAEAVTVESGATILQTQSAIVSTTLTGRQMVDLPLVSRDALDLVLFLPNVNTPGRPRTSTVDGLPKGAINITIDGINVQDNSAKSTD